jgi:hypothetical protein
MERWTKTLFYSASGDGGRGLLSAANGGDRKQYPVSSNLRAVLGWVHRAMVLACRRVDAAEGRIGPRDRR